MPYIDFMNGVHLGALDLNLSVALDALWAERSVTRRFTNSRCDQ
jgi:hypothetical protein